MEDWAEKIKQQEEKALAELIKHYGSQAELGRAIGESRQVVQNWVARGRISAQAAIKVEKATEGKFTKRYMRPAVAVWRDEE